MKIAISGAQCTGKSTLIKALFDDPEINDEFILRDETTRNLLRDKLGLGALQINENGGDATQRLICAQHLINSVVGDTTDVIYDRCALDGVVYTHYLYANKKVTKKTMRIAEELFRNIEYDMVLYIPPEFPIQDDGERSINQEFQDNVVELFDHYIESYRLPVGYLTGTVEERVQQVKQAIAEYKEQNDNN